jgi:hypothetical protein
LGRITDKRTTIFHDLVDYLQEGDIITLGCQHLDFPKNGVPFNLVQEREPTSIYYKKFVFKEPSQKFSFLADSKFIERIGTSTYVFWKIRETQSLNDVYVISGLSKISEHEWWIQIYLNGKWLR